MLRRSIQWRRLFASTAIIPYLLLTTGLSHSLHHGEDHHHCDAHSTHHSDHEPTEEKQPESQHSHDCGLCYLITTSVAADTVIATVFLQWQEDFKALPVIDIPTVPVLGTNHAPRAPPVA